MSLRVLAAGTHSLLVDRGRPSSRGLGIPVGGAADRASLMLGNALAGNPPFTPALEITLTGPTLLAEADVGVCVLGAPFQLFRDGESVSSESFTLRAGQTLRVGGTPSGCRAYLCVPGGFRAKQVLDSVTGFEAIQAGDLLECQASELPGRSLEAAEPEARSEVFSLPPALRGGGKARPRTEVRVSTRRAAPPTLALPPQCRGEGTWRLRRTGAPAIIRCLPGPQADWFDNAFFAHTYRITPASNRMGIRLDGPSLVLLKRELVSEPVAPGAIQITNEGKPIVLGVDGQTIGGYSKVAHVISADLDALGQLRPGEDVRFKLVSEKVAEAVAAEQREMFRKRLRRIAVAIT